MCGQRGPILVVGLEIFGRQDAKVMQRCVERGGAMSLAQNEAIFVPQPPLVNVRENVDVRQPGPDVASMGVEVHSKKATTNGKGVYLQAP